MSTVRSLQLFHKAAQNLPAYRQFLEKHNCNPELVNGPAAYRQVPPTSKKNYLVPNKLDDLIWKSESDGMLLFCATSGSTGEPYYFPRNERLSWQYSFTIEDYLKCSSYGHGSTLVLVGFGMGVWIGGVITQRAFEIAGQRMKRPLAILPTGYNKKEIFKALKRLSPNFDQTILIGYPPFIKEVVDDAKIEGIDLKKLNLRLFFAAESFTEGFRNYLCTQAGIKNPLTDTLNIYGSADIGAMAGETPLSILIRRLAREDPDLYQAIFGQIEKTPTLAQYNPQYIEFEEVDGELLLTADGALPLIRYAIGDHGGIFDYATIKKIFEKHGVDLQSEIEKAGIAGFANKRHPFVYVYERIDLSVTLHGLNIYPEYVKDGLIHSDITDRVTGRFAMSTKYDMHHNQFLQINVELQKDIRPSKMLERKVLKSIRTSMIQKSSEFAEVSKSKTSSDLVHIVLWSNGDHRYFAPGTKQKWVDKS